MHFYYMVVFMRVYEKLFGKRVTVSQMKRMRRYYDELIQRKEREIEALKADKQLLLRHGLTQAEKRRELLEHSRKVLEINKELNALAKENFAKRNRSDSRKKIKKRKKRYNRKRKIKNK